MKMIFSVVLGTCLILMPCSILNAQAKPSLGVFSAALEDQENKSKPGLTIVYKFYSGITEKKLVYVFTYVRTPSIIFREDHSFRDGKLVRIQKYLYDRKTNAYKIMEYFRSRDETNYETNYVIGPGKPEMFTTPTFMDPVFFVVNGSFLLDLIKEGKARVLPNTERIDDQKCYIIEGQAYGQVSRNFRVWLDPDIGCCPRKIEQTIQTNSGRRVGTWKLQN